MCLQADHLFQCFDRKPVCFVLILRKKLHGKCNASLFKALCVFCECGDACAAFVADDLSGLCLDVFIWGVGVGGGLDIRKERKAMCL